MLKVRGARRPETGLTRPRRSAGTLLDVSAEGLVVVCGEGSRLLVTEVQPESRRPMSAAAFAAGARLRPGDVSRLRSPDLPSPARRLALSVLDRVGGSGAPSPTLSPARRSRPWTRASEPSSTSSCSAPCGAGDGWTTSSAGSRGARSRRLGRRSGTSFDWGRTSFCSFGYRPTPRSPKPSTSPGRRSPGRRGSSTRCSGVCSVRARPPSPTRDDPAEWLTTAGSLPGWLADRWLSRLGPETAVARARALLAPPPTVFRLNPRVDDAADRAGAAGLTWCETGVPGALEITGGRAGALADEGLLYVQDLGSQIVAHLRPGSGADPRRLRGPGRQVAPSRRPPEGPGPRRRGRRLAAAAPHPGATAEAVGRPRRLAPRGRRPTSPLRRPRSTWSSSTRRAAGSAPSGATRTSAGASAPSGHAPRPPSARDPGSPRPPRPGGRSTRLRHLLDRRRGERGRRAAFPRPPPRVSPTTDLLPWARSFAAGRFVRMDPAAQPGDAFFAASLVRRR